MMSQNENKMPQLLHQAALRAGFTETIPVIPPGAPLHEHSRVDPKMTGKVPGDYYGGAWDGMGSWPSYEMNEMSAIRWDTLRANVGLKCGYQTVGLDVDITDAVLMQAMRNRLLELGVNAPIRVGQAPKALWLFRITGEPIKRRQYPMRHEGVQERQLIEVMGVTSKGRPSQAVIFGTHPSGAEYTWDQPLDFNRLPAVTQEQMDHLVSELLEVGRQRGWEPGRPSTAGSNDGTGSNLGAQPADQSMVGPVVDLIKNDDLEYDDWVRVGYAIKAALGEGGWPIWEKWSQKAPKAVAADTLRTWKSLTPDGSTGFGRLVYMARHDSGGMLPGNLEAEVRRGINAKGMEMSGMPVQAPPAPVAALMPPGVPVADIPMPAEVEWTDYVLDKDGHAIQNAANIAAYIGNTPDLRDCFAYNAFTNQQMLTKTIPYSKDPSSGRPLNDVDVIEMRNYFQRCMFPKAAKGDVADAVDIACRDASYEPVQSYLEGLKWDGVHRLDTWLFDYGGVLHGGNDRYVSQVGRRWLISAVARAMKPGCQADYALIMEGNQGRGKSSILRALCPDPDWFGDSLPDFHTKDASQYLQGKWIVEMAELTGVYKSDLESMRSFLTRRVESYRPAYGRLDIHRPRRCVFSGSTNRDNYLKDNAGERRFWIIKIQGETQPGAMATHRDQIWAEAMAAFVSGEKSWLDADVEAIALAEQKNRVEVDPWEDMIRLQLDMYQWPEEVTISGIMTWLMMTDLQSRSKVSQNRIKDCITAFGYESVGRVWSTSYRGKTVFRRRV